MQCTALIVDDEPLARVRMRSLLAPYSSEIEIVGEASSGAQAINKIEELCRVNDTVETLSAATIDVDDDADEES